MPRRAKVMTLSLTDEVTCPPHVGFTPRAECASLEQGHARIAAGLTFARRPLELGP
jgi:hypothetical protein